MTDTTRQDRKRGAKGRFRKGRSGNPRGRPKGSRNKTTLAAQALLEGQAEKLTQKTVELALNGDVTALRLCLERFYPVQKDRLVEFDLPKLEDQSDATEAIRRILKGVSEGKLTVQEAETLNGIVVHFQESILAEEL